MRTMIRLSPGAGRRRPARCRARHLALSLAGLAGLAGSALKLDAQSSARARDVEPSLPVHEPLNPLVAERSGLYVQPYVPRGAGWRWGARLEYGSAVERDLDFPSSYLFDAEILRAQLRVTRDLSPRWFVAGEIGAGGAFAGVADRLFEDYHRLIRFTMEERDTRPRNVYGDRLKLQEFGIDRVRRPHGILPTDARATLGLREGRWAQSAVSVTLPTAPSASALSRGVPTVSVLQTVRARPLSPLLFEVTGGVGAAPRTGELSPVQRRLMVLGSGAARLQFAPHHALFATVYAHGPAYRGTNLPELDGADLSIDFGYLWVAPDRRQWRLGLTEDVRRRDAGIDLVMKLSVQP